MDAFGYKTDGSSTTFIWIVIDHGQVVALNGPIGVLTDAFYVIGPQSPALYEQAIHIAQENGYVFDFNEKCQELMVRFPLSGIADVGRFRFETVEPLLQYTLQQSGNGFCDYAFCDAEFLNVMPYVYAADIAVPSIVLALSENDIRIADLQIWHSKEGVPQTRLWPI